MTVHRWPFYERWKSGRHRNARIAVVVALVDGPLAMDGIEFKAGLSRERTLRALGSLVSEGVVEVVPLEDQPRGSVPTLRFRLRENR